MIALIGDPVERSLSPAMHNAAFRELGLGYIYVALTVPKGSLGDAIAGVRALGIAGLNVTHPHKVEIVDMLDDLDESARLVGSVNTVKNDRGRLVGYNTDGVGAVRALEEEVGSLRGKMVVLLGAGGAARAIAFSLAEAGARLAISNRTHSRALGLAADIKHGLGVDVGYLDMGQELADAIDRADILINATTVGMYPDIGSTLVTSDMMHKGLVVNDIVYDPPKTRLLREARRAGARPIGGLGMLIHQGALSSEIWTGKRAPMRIMESAAKRELRRRVKG